MDRCPFRARAGALSLALVAACGRPAAAPPGAPAAAPAPAHEHAHHGDDHGHGQGGAHLHRFERAADWAPIFDDPARDAWQKPDEVVALLELRPGMAVVDLGAGTGYFLARLSRAVGPAGKVVATDIEPDLVRHMTERIGREQLGNARAVLVAGDAPGLPEAGADRILVVDVWHHIPDRARYAGLLARALAPGGRLAIVDFTLASKHGPPAKHRLSPEAVIAELAAAGLTAEVVREDLPEQYVVVGRRP